jgi:hypothetical protein
MNHITVALLHLLLYLSNNLFNNRDPSCPCRALIPTHPEIRFTTAPAQQRASTPAQQRALDDLPLNRLECIATLLMRPDFADVTRNQVHAYVTQRTTPMRPQVRPANQGAFPSGLGGVTLGFYTDCGIQMIVGRRNEEPGSRPNRLLISLSLCDPRFAPPTIRALSPSPWCPRGCRGDVWWLSLTQCVHTQASW